jgi:methionyl-tRNA formyltransferase
MAIQRIILLSDPAEGPHLAAILMAHAPSLKVELATTLAELQTAASQELADTRLVSFCSSVIVPADILQALPGPAYNFHPGPPEFPGRYPSVFALYQGAERFGFTVHEMAPKVDAGAIVAVDWFTIPVGCDVAKLEELTFAALADQFRALARHLATSERALIRLPYRWGLRKTTKADRDELCRITPDMDAAEIERRKRACGLVTLVNGDN